MSWERILDVNLNRLTEALKFLEDVIRFSYPDQIKLTEIRKLRRDFLTIKKKIPLMSVIGFRQSRRDPGRKTGFDQRTRESYADLVLAGCARAKESSRTLEEILKLSDPAAAGRMKEMRFQIYDLEKSLLDKIRRRFDPGFQVILDETFVKKLKLPETIRILERHGATMIQLRVKSGTDRYFYRLARKIRGLIEVRRVAFIVNDRPDIAQAASADGVHLGTEDLPVRKARMILGPDYIIGASAGTLSEAARAQAEGADYLGAGAVFLTSTKPDAFVCGLKELRRIALASSIPVIAIGGINRTNIRVVRKTGVAGIAVGSFLFDGNLRKNLRLLTGK
jgi:thiamine-phosphate pyrophosphorylase